MQKESKGVMQVMAVLANDGRKVVVIEWPDGSQLMFERDEFVQLCITGLQAVSKLYPTATAFSQSIDHARSQMLNLHPASMQ